MTRQWKTALVFAGGGSLGAVQIGMVKALVAVGVDVDVLVGASVGAINAAYLATRGLESIAGLEAVWRHVRRADIFPLGIVHALLGLLSVRESLVSPAPLRTLLEREVGGRRFDDTRLPLFVVATDMESGREIVLSRGSLVPALMASAAIPGVFPPVTIGGRRLMDGGVANNTPISTAVALGATRILVLPTGTPCSCDRFPRGALFVAVHALNVGIARQLAVDLIRFEERAELIVVPPRCPLDAAVYSFRATGELITRAERHTRVWLEAGGLEKPAHPKLSVPHGPECPCSEKAALTAPPED